MKFMVALVLVIFSMVAAESPRPKQFLARQSAAPYQPRGWRPSGPQFNLPLRSQKQVQQPQPPVPAASYGPPPASSYGPPEEATTTTTEALPTTTEIIEETTTLEPEAENILDADQEVSAKLENPGSYYVVVPQTQKLVASPLVALKSAKLVSTPALPRRVPVQAIPAFAKIQELPQVFETVPYIQTVPLASSSAYINAVNTPFSSSYIQVVQ